ncbi:MAG: response regulator [Sphingopyxis sp.]|uniref:response regulator n=1 Tax=Sphingopyxis sp. TaxID=1908224 RepID=UPI002AB9EA74|nr:response regulator [Sphingopyxis sp.]MDZ3831543.1 response regulator [Sphingopyxis sp.]
MSNDCRILLVEDDVLIGMMLVDMFDVLGFPEPAQATSNAEALAILASEPIGGALVDINLGEEKGWPVADALAERGIPFAFTSGGGDVIPPAHSDRKLVSKPFRLNDIEAVLRGFSAE